MDLRGRGEWYSERVVYAAAASFFRLDGLYEKEPKRRKKE